MDADRSPRSLLIQQDNGRTRVSALGIDVVTDLRAGRELFNGDDIAFAGLLRLARRVAELVWEGACPPPSFRNRPALIYFIL